MTLPPDYHMHTPLCHHAVGEPIEYAARAVQLGLDEIGFSDHSPMRQDGFDEWRMNRSDLPNYVEKVEQAREAFPNLRIRLALEVDYLPGHEDWIRELRTLYRWDYFIGAVHYVSESWDMDNPAKLSLWRERDPWEVWSVYFERLALAAESKLFDIIAHADLCKKFCFYPKQDCTPLYARFLDAARGADVAIELNTAGLRKDCKEIYPNAQILKMAKELGIPITFASDAHAPDEVGMNFAEALTLARAAGYSESCRFKAGHRTMVPLP